MERCRYIEAMFVANMQNQSKNVEIGNESKKMPTSPLKQIEK